MGLGNRSNVRRDQLRTIEDVKKHVVVTGDCWLWSDSKSKGMGKVYVSNADWEPAQQTVWRITHPNDRAIPVPAQKCGRLACVRPDHLTRLVVRGELAPSRKDGVVALRTTSRKEVKKRARALCDICGKPETHWMERAHLFGRGTKGAVNGILADQPEFSVWGHKGCHTLLDSYAMKDRQEEMRWEGVRRMVLRFGLDPPFTIPASQMTARLAALWVEEELRRLGFLQRLAGRGWRLTE